MHFAYDINRTTRAKQLRLQAATAITGEMLLLVVVAVLVVVVWQAGSIANGHQMTQQHCQSNRNK